VEFVVLKSPEICFCHLSGNHVICTKCIVLWCVQVDCSRLKQLCLEQEIAEYPTIRAYHDGTSVSVLTVLLLHYCYTDVGVMNWKFI